MNPEVRAWINSKLNEEQIENHMAFIQGMEGVKPREGKSILPDGWTDPEAFTKLCELCDFTGRSKDDLVKEIMEEASDLSHHELSEGLTLDDIFNLAFNRVRTNLGFEQVIPAMSVW